MAEEIELIENNAEHILQDIIALYKRKTAEEPQPASPERLIIDVFAYREMLLRATMQRIMEQNFVQMASAQYLDYWGELFGVPRLDNEIDDDFRKRILARSTKVAVGTREAYYDKITTLTQVTDVKIESKQDDDTLPPGVIRLYPLAVIEEDGVSKGAVHTDETEGLILDHINDKDFALIGEEFIFSSAKPVEIDGSISLVLVSGVDEDAVIEEVGKVLDAYLGEISLKYKGVFEVNELERRIRTVSGVRENSTLTFINTPNLEDDEFVIKGTINILRQ